jgi:hypothetical protein
MFNFKIKSLLWARHDAGKLTTTESLVSFKNSSNGHKYAQPYIKR